MILLSTWKAERCQTMLTLYYYSNSASVRAALRQVAAAWWTQDDDPVYSKDLIKEFEVENPPLEDELAWILSKGTATYMRYSDHARLLSKILSRAWEELISKQELCNCNVVFFQWIVSTIIFPSKIIILWNPFVRQLYFDTVNAFLLTIYVYLCANIYMH